VSRSPQVPGLRAFFGGKYSARIMARSAKGDRHRLAVACGDPFLAPTSSIKYLPGMKRAALPCLLLAWCWLGSLTPAFGQLRILDYNVGASSSSSPGPRPGMDTVLAAINAQTKPGFARPIDIMLMQEGESTSTTGVAYANLLNTITSSTTYMHSVVNGATTGAGRPMAVYNSASVTLISEQAIGVTSSSGAARQTLRYQFRPVGYDASADFYIYNSHLKANDTSTDANRRNVEAQANRANADALGANVNVIYVGDLNLYTASEAAFQTLTAAGNGRAFDPIDQVGNWSDNAAFLPYHTQSPATTAAYPGQVTGGMDDRFDFQLVTGAWLDGRGLDYITDSYWAFGNTGTHTLGEAITTGSPSSLQAYLPGYSLAQSGTILTRLSQVTDHLPVVADYQLPAKMSASLTALPSKVITGAMVSSTLSVSNSAPVSVVQGADRLDYSYSSTGIFTGSGTGSDMALGSASTHALVANTATVGLVSGTVSVLATSPQAASPSFSQTATMSVLDHAISSLVSGSTVTTLNIDFGTLTQGTGTTSQNVSIFNRVGTMGAMWTAKLDLDSVVASVPGSIFSTTLSPFTNLASGSSRTYGLSMLTTTTGSFSGTYTLNLSDEDLPGATGQSMLVNVRGSVVSPANAILNVASGTQTQSNLGFGPITGVSSLTKTGSGTILLDGLNTFTGTTSVEQGIAALNGPGAIASSSLVTVAAGASLDVRSLSGGYTVASGQTLGGSGTVLGSVVFGRGSTLSPGLAGVAISMTQIAAVPEPSAWVLAVAGLCCVGLRRNRPR
jgi:autotransporter-associated beta strand protein